MSSFYHIQIPVEANLRQLAQILDSKGDTTRFYWNSKTSQVVVEQGDKRWVQPNGLVTHSLAAVFGCSPNNIIAKNLFLFETPRHGKAADEEMTVGFYDCEWSDYGNDHIAIQFSLVVDTTCITSAKRLLKVVKLLLQERAVDDEDEEDDEGDEEKTLSDDGNYDDMPGLIPIDDHLNTAFRDDYEDADYDNCRYCACCHGRS